MSRASDDEAGRKIRIKLASFLITMLQVNKNIMTFSLVYKCDKLEIFL